jgi:3-phenylpropionate/cinnamic acid dioxygenase small subunit
MSDTTTTELRKASEAERREIEDFLTLEARLADESRYAEWEELVEPDMYYWIPRGEGDFDRDRDISITADNRSRLANRIKQLKTGARHAQVPPSPMRRLYGNVEAYLRGDGEYTVFCNFSLFEMRVQSTGHLQVWAGRMEFHLRRRDGGLRMFFKRVSLINGDQPVPSIAFIL